MTPRKVAESLGVSVWTVYRLISGRRVSAIQVGGRWRVDPVSVETYLAAQTTTARHVVGAQH